MQPTPDGPKVSEVSAPDDVELPRTPTEQSLAAVWEEVLGLSPVGRDDRFADLGGTSLLAERALGEFRRRFALELTPAMLVGTPALKTIAERLDEVRTERFRARETSMTSFETAAGADAPVVLCIVGAGSTAIAYLPLISRIGTGARVHAFQQHGFMNRGVAHHTVVAGARTYFKQAQDIPGEITLVGHSFGAYGAIETAKLFEQSGREVARLVLVDPVLKSAHGASVADFSGAAETPGWRQRMRTHWRIATAGLVQRDVTVQQSTFWELGIRAQNRYTSALLRGGATKLPGRTSAIVITDENQAQEPHWRRVAPATPIHRVPGTHTGVISDPGTLDLIERLVLNG